MYLIVLEILWVFSKVIWSVVLGACFTAHLVVKLVKMLKLVLTLPLAVAMPVDHRAERQKMVRCSALELLA